MHQLRQANTTTGAALDNVGLYGASRIWPAGRRKSVRMVLGRALAPPFSRLPLGRVLAGCNRPAVRPTPGRGECRSRRSPGRDGTTRRRLLAAYSPVAVAGSRMSERPGVTGPQLHSRHPANWCFYTQRCSVFFRLTLQGAFWDWHGRSAHDPVSPRAFRRVPGRRHR